MSATQAFEAVIQATAGKAKGIKTSTMDGVGVAALAAAEQHKKFSKESYLFWKVTQPPCP